MNEETVAGAVKKFRAVVESEISRAEAMEGPREFIDYAKLDRIVIGVAGGDGIGPIISGAASMVIEFLLSDEIDNGMIELRAIEGLTIENRVASRKAVPDDVMDEIKKCSVILKGPTTTPREGDGWPNMESANIYLRRGLDLFANVRPVRIPREGIDWTFFRENTEGSYILGSRGFHVTGDIAMDFRVITARGTERIARAAFEYARKKGKTRVTIVTKANVIKATDGKFLTVCREVGKDYPEISVDDWYVDIIAAKLIDEGRRSEFQVFVLPNLYGDIITDEAAQIQGGVGTAGSANIGYAYAMFEAVHGSALRMVAEGRAQFANPASLLRAAVLMLMHIGCTARAEELEKALDICNVTERKLSVTGRPDGATAQDFAGYVVDTVKALRERAVLDVVSHAMAGNPSNITRRSGL
jgi:isocitrate dehydrogenase (NAD+)